MTDQAPETKSIFLWGFSGSGKTTLGIKLAKRMGYRFVDLDTMIEEEAGMSVESIFAKSGEMVFRDMEKSLLHKIPLEGTVVATGGGSPCFYDNAEWMNAHGLTIWLRAHRNTILQRLAGSKQVRPLLSNLSKAEAEGKIEKLLQARQAFYGLAKLEVETENLKVGELLEIIHSHFRRD